MILVGMCILILVVITACNDDISPIGDKQEVTYPKEECWNEEIQIKYVFDKENLWYDIPCDYKLICDDGIWISSGYCKIYPEYSDIEFGVISPHNYWIDLDAKLERVNKNIDKVCFSVHTEHKCKLILSNGEEILPK